MKKQLSSIAGFVISIICTALLILLSWQLFSNIDYLSDADKIIYFTEDGEFLHIFGETLTFGRESLDAFPDYLSNCLKFHKELLPLTLQKTAESYTDSLLTELSAFAKALFGAVYGFFTFGM